MIPTLLLVGVAFGRWWRVCVPVAAVAWVVAVMTTSDLQGLDDALAGAALAVINLAIGVVVFQVARWLFRRLRRRPARVFDAA